MTYTDKMENVTVLGAAGKMGSGIVLLTALEMADLSLQPENKSRSFVLNAVDLSAEALKDLVGYIRAQALKAAEKKVMLLRKLYANRADLVENGEIIQQYVMDVMAILRPTTSLESTYSSELIFEAASENPDLKVKLFLQINENSTTKPFFLTNTSSIPITQLDEDAKLDGRIIGFHFYNPPAVQKLVEIIEGKHTAKELSDFALEYAKRLRKVVVPSNDIAGFIGNGHFMRDAIYGMQQAEKLANDMPFVEAVYTINKVSQDFLVRPMGIFQLIDYVGIDVCQYIMKVMDPHMQSETIHSPLLDKFMEMGVKGGQNPDGSQKDGFLKYEKGRVVGVFDPEKKEYIMVDGFAANTARNLGDMPVSIKPWKAVIRDKNKDAYLQSYFNEVKNMKTTGARLAAEYLQQSKNIGLNLVNSGVAKTNDDVNTVLLTGFFHAYGPINDFI